ncbi:hypothetical protein [Pseudomonas sp. RA_105y_Pfl1_P41]|uniref:hypothetical protein n=1 Tax=Pseudomonas sp. RA_105y_Pfl1_P41 TaxID=3088700 RepID=UPI0030D91897
MGAKPKVNHVRDEFIAEINTARNLVVAIRGLPRWSPKSTGAAIHTKHVNQVVELAFMGLVASWEEFLERSLVRYLAGAATDKNYSPVPKYGSADSISHAYELLSQDSKYDPLKNYLKVSDPRWVYRTADFFFRSHPYGVLNPKTDLIRHASAIRNRVAHSSDKCRSEFKKTALDFLGPAKTSLSSGYSPGTFLLAPAQRIFTGPAIQKNISHFEAFATMFEDLAHSIVP